MKSKPSNLKKQIHELTAKINQKKHTLHHDYSMTKYNLIPISGVLAGGLLTWYLISRKRHQHDTPSSDTTKHPKQFKLPINSLLQLALIPVIKSFLNNSSKQNT